MNQHFYLKLELFCKGRAIYDQSKIEFPLHKAVFDKNLPLVSRLIKCQHDGIFYAEKNELDSCGNTPLMLAVKQGNIDCVKVLCDLFTCPKLKSFSSCNLTSLVTPL
jgi:ankyrin repeat protein